MTYPLIWGGGITSDVINRLLVFAGIDNLEKVQALLFIERFVVVVPLKSMAAEFYIWNGKYWAKITSPEISTVISIGLWGYKKDGYRIIRKEGEPKEERSKKENIYRSKTGILFKGE